MKKINKIKILSLICIMVLGFASCEDFLDRPAEDAYNLDNFYQTDEQCYQAVNPIYSSPWYDMQRYFFKTEILAGNLYLTNDPYLTFTVNSTDADLVNMSASLWSVNAYCNGIIENIDMKAGSDVSEVTKTTVKGEALLWKALTYFYLVRSFGAVPIIHNNSESIAAGGYNDVYKAEISDVYDYIIKTLEKAIEWLPERNLGNGNARWERVDRYSAYALLAKVYLTKSGYGMSGSRNAGDLQKAAEYSKLVIENSGRELMPVYSDLFRLQNNANSECLISWRWTTQGSQWTRQNSFQSDLGLAGFSEFNDTWGDSRAPSVDLQDAFGENALSLTRNNRDTRRKATMMMYGDKYEYFWVDKGGFDWADYVVNERESVNGLGANCVKHLVGNSNDHKGYGDMERMATGLATHLLRLADVYLIYAEAVIGNNGSTTDASALSAFNKVFLRAIPGETAKTSITWQDVWKERRLELAIEGDRWFDFVRWHYYEPQKAIDEIKAQRRASYTGLLDYYRNGSLDPSITYYAEHPIIPNVMDRHFELPFPDTDISMNKHLLEDPVHVDISQFEY